MMEAFWQRFEDDYMARVRRVRGRREAPVCSGDMMLSADPGENDRLLMEILHGPRRALMDTLEHVNQQGRAILGSNEYFILVDSAGTPRAVIRTTGAHIVAFRRMEERWALLEGEDKSLAAWQARWRETLLREAREKQRPLSLETLMVAETFTVAYTE